MRSVKRIAAVAVVAGLVGCGPILSLHPFYTDGDVVFESALLGRWVDEEGGWWTLEDEGGGTYELTITPAFSDVERFPSNEAVLFRLGESYFMDFTPGEVPDCEESEVVCLAPAFPVIPAHMAGRIRFEGSTMRVDFLKEDWVAGQIRDGGLDIRHEKIDDGILLTAPAPDLRNLLVLAGGDEGAFGDGFVLRR